MFSVAVAELENKIEMKLLVTFHRDSTFKKKIKLKNFAGGEFQISTNSPCT